MITLLTSFHKAKFQGSPMQEQITNHLLRLPPEDRHSRFFVSLPDAAIERYVQIIDLDRDFIFCSVDEYGDVDGVLHAARGDDGTMDFGISVDEASRGRGIGSELFEAAIALVHMMGCREVYVNCLSINKSMNAIARKFCDSVERVELDSVLGKIEFTDPIKSSVNYKIGGIVVSDSTLRGIK